VIGNNCLLNDKKRTSEAYARACANHAKSDRPLASALARLPRTRAAATTITCAMKVRAAVDSAIAVAVRLFRDNGKPRSCRARGLKRTHRGRGDSDAKALELADDPTGAPARILTSQSKDQAAQRKLKRRPPRRRVRIRPASGDELTMPTEQRLWLHGETRPRWPRKRAAQRCQQRAVSRGEVRTTRLPTQDRQLVSQNQDLQLLRATRPGQQRQKREEVTDGEIHKRPRQAWASHSMDGKSADTTAARPHPDEDRV
jgi:hypothetical protein